MPKQKHTRHQRGNNGRQQQPQQQQRQQQPQQQQRRKQRRQQQKQQASQPQQAGSNQHAQSTNSGAVLTSQQASTASAAEGPVIKSLAEIRAEKLRRQQQQQQQPHHHHVHAQQALATNNLRQPSTAPGALSPQQPLVGGAQAVSSHNGPDEQVGLLALAPVIPLMRSQHPPTHPPHQPAQQPPQHQGEPSPERPAQPVHTRLRPPPSHYETSGEVPAIASAPPQTAQVNPSPRRSIHERLSRRKRPHDDHDATVVSLPQNADAPLSEPAIAQTFNVVAVPSSAQVPETSQAVPAVRRRRVDRPDESQQRYQADEATRPRRIRQPVEQRLARQVPLQARQTPEDRARQRHAYVRLNELETRIKAAAHDPRMLHPQLLEDLIAAALDFGKAFRADIAVDLAVANKIAIQPSLMVRILDALFFKGGITSRETRLACNALRSLDLARALRQQDVDRAFDIAAKGPKSAIETVFTCVAEVRAEFLEPICETRVELLFEPNDPKQDLSWLTTPLFKGTFRPSVALVQLVFNHLLDQTPIDCRSLTKCVDLVMKSQSECPVDIVDGYLRAVIGHGDEEDRRVSGDLLRDLDAYDERLMTNVEPSNVLKLATTSLSTTTPEQESFWMRLVERCILAQPQRVAIADLASFVREVAEKSTLGRLEVFLDQIQREPVLAFPSVFQAAVDVCIARGRHAAARSMLQRVKDSLVHLVNAQNEGKDGSSETLDLARSKYAQAEASILDALKDERPVLSLQMVLEARDEGRPVQHELWTMLVQRVVHDIKDNLKSATQRDIDVVDHALANMQDEPSTLDTTTQEILFDVLLPKLSPSTVADLVHGRVGKLSPTPQQLSNAIATLAKSGPSIDEAIQTYNKLKEMPGALLELAASCRRRIPESREPRRGPKVCDQFPSCSFTSCNRLHLPELRCFAAILPAMNQDRHKDALNMFSDMIGHNFFVGTKFAWNVIQRLLKTDVERAIAVAIDLFKASPPTSTDEMLPLNRQQLFELLTAAENLRQPSLVVELAKASDATSRLPKDRKAHDVIIAASLAVNDMTTLLSASVDTRRLSDDAMATLLEALVSDDNAEHLQSSRALRVLFHLAQDCKKPPQQLLSKALSILAKHDIRGCERVASKMLDRLEGLSDEAVKDVFDAVCQSGRKPALKTAHRLFTIMLDRGLAHRLSVDENNPTHILIKDEHCNNARHLAFALESFLDTLIEPTGAQRLRSLSIQSQLSSNTVKEALALLVPPIRVDEASSDKETGAEGNEASLVVDQKHVVAWVQARLEEQGKRLETAPMALDQNLPEGFEGDKSSRAQLHAQQEDAVATKAASSSVESNATAPQTKELSIDDLTNPDFAVDTLELDWQEPLDDKFDDDDDRRDEDDHITFMPAHPKDSAGIEAADTEKEADSAGQATQGTSDAAPHRQSPGPAQSSDAVSATSFSAQRRRHRRQRGRRGPRTSPPPRADRRVSPAARAGERHPLPSADRPMPRGDRSGASPPRKRWNSPPSERMDRRQRDRSPMTGRFRDRDRQANDRRGPPFPPRGGPPPPVPAAAEGRSARVFGHRMDPNPLPPAPAVRGPPPPPAAAASQLRFDDRRPMARQPPRPPIDQREPFRRRWEELQPPPASHRPSRANGQQETFFPRTEPVGPARGMGPRGSAAVPPPPQAFRGHLNERERRSMDQPQRGQSLNRDQPSAGRMPNWLSSHTHNHPPAHGIASRQPDVAAAVPDGSSRSPPVLSRTSENSSHPDPKQASRNQEGTSFRELATGGDKALKRRVQKDKVAESLSVLMAKLVAKGKIASREDAKHFARKVTLQFVNPDRDDAAVISNAKEYVQTYFKQHGRYDRSRRQSSGDS